MFGMPERSTLQVVMIIVQHQAPSELCYMMRWDQAEEFLDAWRSQNPDMLIRASTIPLIRYQPGQPIPMEYP